jgi:chemotaxis protein MotB
MAQRPPPTPSSRESGVEVKGYKPRRFPWRLWMYAIFMTAVAGAGGYFVWQYRGKANDATDTVADRDKKLGECNGKAKDLETCNTALGAATVKAKELSDKLDIGSKNLTASEAELAQLRLQKAESDKRQAAIEDIQKQFAKMIDTGQLRVSARRGQLVISLPSEVLFPSGSADLSKQGEYAAVEVAAVLKKFGDRRFIVVGHTDNQDFAKPKAGTPEANTCVPKDNWQLSTERALTVTRVMVTAGMKQENLIAAGVGDHDPIASNSTAEGRQRNRRIEIALLPAINELPPLPASLKEETSPAGTPAPKK